MCVHLLLDNRNTRFIYFGFQFFECLTTLKEQKAATGRLMLSGVKILTLASQYSTSPNYIRRGIPWRGSLARDDDRAQGAGFQLERLWAKVVVFVYLSSRERETKLKRGRRAQSRWRPCLLAKLGQGSKSD